MAKKKRKRVARTIVMGHLEKVSSKVFDRYRKQITEMIRGNYGVYALYRRDKLYYVGLATDFRRRINQHLRDRHKKKWNHFSLYIIGKSDHIREVEALLLRIADPTGNSQRGRLSRSKDLRPELKRLLVEDSKRVIDEILGVERKARKPRAIRKKERAPERTTRAAKPLRGFFEKRTRIYASYKGETYRATVFTSGTVKFDGQLYNSPSAAGKAAREGKATNGWSFWKTKNSAGELVPLATLRG